MSPINVGDGTCTGDHWVQKSPVLEGLGRPVRESAQSRRTEGKGRGVWREGMDEQPHGVCGGRGEVLALVCVSGIGWESLQRAVLGTCVPSGGRCRGTGLGEVWTVATGVISKR